MREILFRGKRIDNGEWVDGAFCEFDVDVTEDGDLLVISRSNIIDYSDELLWNEVDPETVGQYTGLSDENGKKIFEGDIVRIKGNLDYPDYASVDYIALIAFIDGGFCAIDGTIEEHALRRYNLARMDFDLEIIGNIHDNKLEDFNGR